jgi:DNA polymerase phi
MRYFQVLSVPESAAGQQELFDQDQIDSDGEVDDEGEGKHPSKKLKRQPKSTVGRSTGQNSDDSGEAMAEGDKMGNRSKPHPGSDESGTESGEGGDSDDEEGTDDEGDDEDAGDEETAKLNAALAAIVGTKQYGASMADADTSGTGRQGSFDTDSDADMDDDAMFALDERMAEVFRQRKQASNSTRKNKRQEAAEARENVVRFKNRVLDLLDVYAKREHSTARPRCVLAMLLPLLGLARTSRSKQLVDRACGLVRTLAQRSRLGSTKAKAKIVSQQGGGKSGEEDAPPPPQRHQQVPLSVDDVQQAWTLLDRVHEEAARGESRVHAQACSQASLMLVKLLVSSANATIAGGIGDDGGSSMDQAKTDDGADRPTNKKKRKRPRPEEAKEQQQQQQPKAEPNTAADAAIQRIVARYASTQTRWLLQRPHKPVGSKSTAAAATDATSSVPPTCPAPAAAATSAIQPLFFSDFLNWCVSYRANVS